MDKDKLLESTRQSAIDILNTKLEDVRKCNSIENLINYYADFMSCPSMHGLRERNCQDYSCKSCWRYALCEVGVNDKADKNKI